MQRSLTETMVMDVAKDIRITNDGYMVATPRIARTGIQLYYGSELGVTGRDASKVFKVYRPEDQVFDKEAMISLTYKPVTDDHPPVQVGAGNWKDYAVGTIGGEIARDGEYIRVPMTLMDAATIAKVKDGKAELSVGYTCDIEMVQGTTKDGVSYDAIQKNIRGNHLAVVKKARGGAALKIGDAGEALNREIVFAAADAIAAGKISDAALDQGQGLAPNSEYPIMKDGVVFVSGLKRAQENAAVIGDAEINSVASNLLSLIDRRGGLSATGQSAPIKETKMRTIMIDGINCEVADGVHGDVITRHISKLSDTVAALTKDAAEKEEGFAKFKKKKEEEDAKRDAEIATKDAEIAKLTQAVKDSEITPAKLDQMVATRQEIAGKAKALLGDKLVVDGKTVAEIQKQVVDAKLGERAKSYTADQVAVAFDTLTADVKAGDAAPAGSDYSSFVGAGHRPGGLQDMRSAIADGGIQGDKAKVEAIVDARNKRLQDAWKTPVKA